MHIALYTALRKYVLVLRLFAKENKNTSLSCTRVQLPPEVISTIAGAKWVEYLVAPQDSEKGHTNLLCIVLILVYVLLKQIHFYIVKTPYNVFVKKMQLSEVLF